VDIEIRNAQESDFSQILDLFQEFAEFEKTPDAMNNSLERMMREKDLFHCYVAETQGGEIVGFATHFFAYYTWIGKSLYLDDLFVKPDYRGNGLGTLLINKVIDYAKESQCHKLVWQVSDWNKPAIEFYKSLGAEISNTQRDCELVINTARQ
jgi:GNAT superfamily N-acetyltransferase